MKQLDKVMPVVRHHHEAWNGGGYPAGLKGEETPFLARIVAVADSIDAMSSDRPYRKGMPDEKLDSILRDGAGKQWDPKIVDAAFQVRDELRRIGKEERQPLELDVDHWQADMSLVDTVVEERPLLSSACGMLAAWPATNRTAKTCSAKRRRSSNGSNWSRSADPGSSSARNEPIVAGFRADGALSIFFGADPVYQFNAAGELRRAYCDGLLFKAVQGRLVSLAASDSEHEVQLVRHDLDRCRADEFLAAMSSRLRELSTLHRTRTNST